MISAESVEKACSEVGEYTDDNMVDEFDRFFRAQPAVCEFIVEVTQQSGQRIQELALFLSYMVFKAKQMEQSETVAAVTQDDLESAYRDTESWMAQVGQAAPAELQGAIAASLKHDTEPYVLQYVIS